VHPPSLADGAAKRKVDAVRTSARNGGTLIDIDQQAEIQQFVQLPTQTTQALVCVLDRDGRIVLFNDACERATGYSRDEVLGGDARDFVIPPDEADAFGEVLAHVWKTGLSSPQVGHWTTKEGGRRLIAWSNKPVLGDDGVPLHLVTTGLDLTNRAGAAEEARAFQGDVGAKLAEIGRLAQEQRALRRVATLVASEATPERVYTAVSEECARVLEVNGSAVFRFEGDDTATVVGRHDRDGVGLFKVGDRIDADENTAIGTARDSGAPARIDDYLALSTEVAKRMIEIGYRSTVAAPIFVAGMPWGAVAVASSETLPPDSEARLGAFSELVSLAVASAQARSDLRASRARLVKTGDEQRRKLERNLHDGAQQRLVSLALTLRLARAQAASNPSAVPGLLENATQELDTALEELREIARGLHPGALTDHGLTRALEALGARLSVSVVIDVPDERLPEHVEATAYYIVSETLTNVAKHAQASAANVVIRRDGHVLRFEIRDDGRGGADPSAGTGILGLRDRAEAAGGSLFVVSPPGRGTVVTAALPLA
jgi:PAS domain S-box-containing protein